MDTQGFPCTLSHPGLFPAFPRNPPKLPVMAEVGRDALAFVSSLAGAHARTLVSEPLAGIRHVTIRHLSRASQRLEILRRSLLRIVGLALVVFVVMLLRRASRPSDILYNIGVALAGAALIGPLVFLLNGGFGIKKDVVRFHFTRSEQGRPFGLEVDPSDEAAVHQVLLSFGLRFQEDEAGD